MNISKERRNGLEFHIEINDYFGTLATILDLSRQTLGRTARELEVAGYLEKQVNDLLYLQKNYEIKRKGRKRRQPSL